MKYIYYIIAILLVLTAAIFYEIYPPSGPPEKAVLVVNKKVITADEFDKLYASRPSRMDDRADFVNFLITRELLIQEAQREGIDKDESFRRSIQNYYEQSLVKLLMDRKFAGFNIKVDDQELNKYLDFLHRRLHLTIFTFDDAASAKHGRLGKGEEKTVSCDDLSAEMRGVLVGLSEGESTEPFLMGDVYKVIRVDRIEPSDHAAAEAEREEVRKILTEEKKSKMIAAWVADLRSKASVSIPEAGGK